MVGASPDRTEWPVVYLSPRGRPLDQAMARRFAAGQGITLLCGRFEGVDERVLFHYGIEEVSLGDFVLTGGEIAAQALLDATVRLLPNVLGNQASTEELQSGHHGQIAKWRQAQSEALTKARRPDLWQAWQDKKR